MVYAVNSVCLRAGRGASKGIRDSGLHASGLDWLGALQQALQKHLPPWPTLPPPQPPPLPPCDPPPFNAMPRTIGTAAAHGRQGQSFWAAPRAAAPLPPHLQYMG